MKVSVFNTTTMLWEQIELGGPVLRVEAAGAQVSLLVRDGRLDISVNPIHSEWITRIETHEVYVSELQDRLSVAGKRDPKAPPQTDGQYPSVDPA